MVADKCIYVVDTSSWLFISKHPKSNRILHLLTTLLNDGRLKAPPQVFEELIYVEERVNSWILIHKKDIKENQNSNLTFIKRLGEIAKAFPSMSGVKSKKDRADPHVIALASSGVLKASECIVVCEETTAKRPNRKIPTACLEFDIRVMGIMEMLRIEFPNEEWE